MKSKANPIGLAVGSLPIANAIPAVAAFDPTVVRSAAEVRQLSTRDQIAYGLFHGMQQEAELDDARALELRRLAALVETDSEAAMTSEAMKKEPQAVVKPAAACIAAASSSEED